DDWVVIIVRLAHERRTINIFRKIACRLRNLIADIISGLLYILIQVKLNRYAAVPIIAGRRYIPDTVDTVDHLFERLCDLRFNNLRIGSWLRSPNGHYSGVDRWKLSYTQEVEPDHPNQQKHEVHYNGQYRPFNTGG